MVDFFYADTRFQQKERIEVLAAPVVFLQLSHRYEKVVFELAVLGEVFKDTAYPELRGFRTSPVWCVCIQIGAQGISFGEQLAGIALGDNDTFRLVHLLVAAFHELQSDDFAEVRIYGPRFLVEILRILGVGVESLFGPGRGIDGTVFDAGHLLDEVVDRTSGKHTDMIASFGF